MTRRGGKPRATAGGFVCEALLAGMAVRDVALLLQQMNFGGVAGRDLGSALEQVSWYKAQLKAGRRALEYVEGVPLVVNLTVACRSDDPRRGIDQFAKDTARKGKHRG